MLLIFLNLDFESESFGSYSIFFNRANLIEAPKPRIEKNTSIKNTYWWPRIPGYLSIIYPISGVAKISGE